MIGRWSDTPSEEEPKPKGFDDFDLRLGDVMRGERATLGKSLLDVQRELKIKATYIAAIENADPSAFETPGFIAGYVRSYARYLGLDPEWAYGRFCEEGNFAVAHGMSAAASGTRAKRSEPAQPSDRVRDPFAEPTAPFIPAGKAAFSGIEPGAIGSIAVLLLLIGGIGYGGWAVFQQVQKVEVAPVEQAPGVTATVDPLSAATRMMAEAGGVEPAFVPPSPDALDRLYRPQALDAPVLVARDGPIATLDPRSVGVLSGAAGAERPITLAGGPQVPGAPGEAGIDAALAEALGQDVQVAEAPPEVVLFAVRPSWVRVQAADGTVLFEKILDAGERYVLPPSDEPARLRAGNAGSVYFGVNGETFGPAGTGPSVVKDVALSVDGLKEAYQVADVSKDADLADYIALAQAQVTPDEATADAEQPGE